MYFRTVLVLSAVCLTLAACSAQPSEPQPSEPQPSEPQPSEPQPSEPQPSEPQPAESQPLGAFDLQAHRGGLGLVSESTIASFTNALDMGVTTLEMDTHITEDGIAVVTHDRQVSDKKCRDTAPAVAGDPEFPYVGKYINTLTAAQVRTLDCGSIRLADFPEQQTSPGAHIPTLVEVLDLVNSRPSDVRLNIETKVEAASPSETAPREQFVDVDLATIKAAGLLDRVTIQSFDWASLMLVRAAEPSVPVVALTEPDFLQVGLPGASPWLGGLDIDDFDGDPIAAIRSFGATSISPVQGSPQNGTVGDAEFEFYVTPDMVRRAHAQNIVVVPWTVDDPATMNALMDMGVDGLITDYPDRLRAVMTRRGLPLPAPAR